MDTANSQQFSIEYADFWDNDGGGSVKGLFSVSEDAAADGVISLDELTAWDLDWTGNTEVAAFSISSDDGSATALVPPSGFSIGGANTAFVPDFSDSDGLDQGLYESGSGEQTIDLGALIVEDVAAGTVSQGSATAGSISVSEVVDFSVNYSGFWGNGESVKGLFSISEADAADGVASLDELVSWSFDWSGNSDVAAFSVSSDAGSATALLPPGGFLLDGMNTPVDANFNDADGLDQGLYEAASGDKTLDLGALIVEDVAAGNFALGSAGVADASITVSKVLDVDVDYTGFWDGGASVTGGFSISEADAADGVASLDELIAWSWDWTGNSDVAAFSVSSDDGSVTALLPPGGFLLDGSNTAVNASFEDADGLDQGLYQSASGDQSIDLGALIIEDFAAATLAQGDVTATGGSITVGDSSSNGGGSADDDGVEIGDSANEAITNGRFGDNADDGIDIEGSGSDVMVQNVLSTMNAEEGIEIDGSNNTISISSAGFRNNGDDGFDIDETGTGNIISITSASFTDNGDDGLDIFGVGNVVELREVGSSGNQEEGFEIDGKDNTVLIRQSSFTANGEDGFDIDETGTGNTIIVSQASFADNGDDGFDVFGSNNTITWSNVTSSGNAEEGFEIDGDDNIITLNQTGLVGNGDDGFQIDAEGSGNTVTIHQSTIAHNVDGIDINGSDNIIGLFQVGINDNSGTAVEVEGDNNTVNISSSMFSNNGEFALLIEGSNNRITITDSSFLGSGNGILDTGNNNIITVMNSTGLGEIFVSDTSTLLVSSL